jgi:hypothetical protein
MTQTVEQPHYHATAEHHLGSELLLSYADQVHAGLKDYVAETYRGQGVESSTLAHSIISNPQAYIDQQMSMDGKPQDLAENVDMWLANVQKIDPPMMLEDMASARKVYAGLVEIATYIAFERRHYDAHSWKRNDHQMFKTDIDERDWLSAYECDAIQTSLAKALLGGEVRSVRTGTVAELVLPKVLETNYLDSK